MRRLLRETLATTRFNIKMGRKKDLSTRLFPILPTLVNTASSLVFHAVLSSGCSQGSEASGGADSGASGYRHGEGTVREKVALLTTIHG
jgi:hypothetical protein